MKLIKFIAAGIYGVFIFFLLRVIFYNLTFWLMGFGWKAVVLYCVVAGGLLSGTLSMFASLLSAPLVLLTSNSIAGRIVPVLSCLIFGFLSIADPWKLDMSYTKLQIFIALSISFIALTIFGTVAFGLLIGIEDKKE